MTETIVVALISLVGTLAGALCALSGALLGIVSYKVMPDYPASDPITAVAVGIVSGLAATGVNQAIKQLKGKSKDNADE